MRTLRHYIWAWETWKHWAVSYKITHKLTRRPSKPAPRYSHKRNKNILTQRPVCACGKQFMPTATNWEKMSWVLSTERINCVKRTNKWYAHIRLKSTYAKWRKLDKRENILCGCIYVKFKKSQNYCNRKQISDC